MIEIECPWCAASAALVVVQSAGPRDGIECADCGVRVEFAPDPIAAEFAHAA